MDFKNQSFTNEVKTERHEDKVKRGKKCAAEKLSKRNQTLSQLHNDTLHKLGDIAMSDDFENNPCHYLTHAIKPIAQHFKIDAITAHSLICYQLQTTGASENARRTFWVSSKTIPKAFPVCHQDVIKIIKANYTSSSFRAFGIKYRHLVLDCALRKNWTGNKWANILANKQTNKIIHDPLNFPPRSQKNQLHVYACDLYEKEIEGQTLISLPLAIQRVFEYQRREKKKAGH